MKTLILAHTIAAVALLGLRSAYGCASTDTARSSATRLTRGGAPQPKPVGTAPTAR